MIKKIIIIFVVLLFCGCQLQIEKDVVKENPVFIEDSEKLFAEEKIVSESENIVNLTKDIVDDLTKSKKEGMENFEKSLNSQNSLRELYLKPTQNKSYSKFSMEIAVFRISNDCEDCVKEFFKAVELMDSVVSIKRGVVMDLIAIEYDPVKITPIEILAEINKYLSASFVG